MNPSTQLLDEMGKLFAEQNAWLDQRFAASMAPTAAPSATVSVAPAHSAAAVASVAPAPSATASLATAPAPSAASVTPTPHLTNSTRIFSGSSDPHAWIHSPRVFSASPDDNKRSPAAATRTPRAISYELATPPHLTDGDELDLHDGAIAGPVPASLDAISAAPLSRSNSTCVHLRTPTPTHHTDGDGRGRAMPHGSDIELNLHDSLCDAHGRTASRMAAPPFSYITVTTQRTRPPSSTPPEVGDATPTLSPLGASSSMVCAADLGKPAVLTLGASKVLDEMWSHRSHTTAIVLVVSEAEDEVPSTLPNRPWPPPTDHWLVNCNVELRPLPWPSFKVVKRSSATGHRGRFWKPPWPIQIYQQIRCVLSDLAVLLEVPKHVSCLPLVVFTIPQHYAAPVYLKTSVLYFRPHIELETKFHMTLLTQFSTAVQIWRTPIAFMIRSLVFLEYLLDAQSMTLDVCWELLMPDMGLLTCIMVLSVSIVGCARIPELVQRKCGGKCRCFLLEGCQLRDIGEAFECQRQPWPAPLLLLLLSDMHILVLLPWSFFSMVDGYLMIWYFCFPWKPPCLPSVRWIISGGDDLGATRKLPYYYQTAVVTRQGFKPWNEISVHVTMMTTLKPADQSFQHVSRLIRATELIIVKLIDGTSVRIWGLVERSSGLGIPWVLFLAIASVYGYWNLQYILALFSLYYPITFDKEVGLGCLIWNTHVSRVAEYLYHELFGTPLLISMEAKDYSRKNMHTFVTNCNSSSNESISYPWSVDDIDAKTGYLSVPLHAELIERQWGGSTHITVEEMKKRISNLLKEYIRNGNTAEACRCIRKLAVPLFHHEVVKRALTLRMESPAAKALITKLLKDTFAEYLSSSQTMNGFYRVDESLAALILAIPSAKSAKSEPTVTHAAAPPALHKITGRQLSKKESKKYMIVQFPWDPGGSDLLHRLGGKPKLKKGGMSGITHGWAIIWVMGLGLGIAKHWPRPQAVTYKSTGAPAGNGKKIIR